MMLKLLALVGVIRAAAEIRCHDVPLFNKKRCGLLLRKGQKENTKRCARKRRIHDTDENGKHICIRGGGRKDKCIKLTGFAACPETCGDDFNWRADDDDTHNCGWANGRGARCRMVGPDGRSGNEACPIGCEKFRECEKRPPNIVVVMVDDLGTANIGFQRVLYDQYMPDTDSEESKRMGIAETHTPFLDKLALQDGVVLRHHYTYRICSPSRCAFQSGRLPVNVNTVNTGIAAHNPDDPFGGFAGIPRKMSSMADLLKTKDYATHFIGKWDAGMATPDHVPSGRGYDSFTGFYQHANDYWTKGNGIASTGELDKCMNEPVDFSEWSPEYSGKVRDEELLTDSCRDSEIPDPKCYKEHTFKIRAKEKIYKHDMSDPFFLVYSTALIHTPLQVPKYYMDKVKKMTEDQGGEYTVRERHIYAAMVNYMNDATEELVKHLKRKGMWDNTLLAFMTDNGGPVYFPGSANNYPLKGGKYNDHEGGVRGTSFIAGGYLPESIRGTVFDGVVSIADWYATFADIAGVGDVSVDPEVTEANNFIEEENLDVPLLKHPDSRSMWQHLLDGTNPRADALHLSDMSLIEWPYKMVSGRQLYAAHFNPLYPDCADVGSLSEDGPLFEDNKVFDVKCPMSTDETENDELLWASRECENGCLYNLEEDPTELNNLADQSSEMRERTDAMLKTLAEMNENNYHPERGEPDMALCNEALNHGGAYGPFVDIDGFYTNDEDRPDDYDDIKELYDFIAENEETFIELYKWTCLETTAIGGWDDWVYCYDDPEPEPPTKEELQAFKDAMTEYCIEQDLKNWNETMQVYLPVLARQIPLVFNSLNQD